MAKKQTISNLPGNIITISGTSSTNTTLTTNGTNLVYSGTSYSNLNSMKSTYHVLGEDIEVSSGYNDPILITNISVLNVLGKPFLDELHKNGTFFSSELEEYLEKKFKWLERDKKIDDIIN